MSTGRVASAAAVPAARDSPPRRRRRLDAPQSSASSGAGGRRSVRDPLRAWGARGHARDTRSPRTAGQRQWERTSAAEQTAASLGSPRCDRGRPPASGLPSVPRRRLLGDNQWAHFDWNLSDRGLFPILSRPERDSERRSRIRPRGAHTEEEGIDRRGREGEQAACRKCVSVWWTRLAELRLLR